MAGGRYDSSLTGVRPFFGALISADPSGESWLSALLSAMPGRAFLGSLVADPGTILGPLTSATARGHLGCFEYPVHPPRALLAWFVEHPDALVWPKATKYSAETTRLRRALVDDSPPGARLAAQATARELAAARPTSAREWWRFEGTSMIDCVILTESLAITVEGKRTEPISPATNWYPRRSQLVRNLEAAKQLSQGRQWGSVLISETLEHDGTDSALEAALPAGAPHLAVSERNELHAHYLGNITWQQACDATGLDIGSLPNSTDEL